jgi:hypothetical protein
MGAKRMNEIKRSNLWLEWMLCFIFLLGSITTTVAQTTSNYRVVLGSVKGYVLDSALHTPIAGITLALYEPVHQTVAATIASNSDGSFHLSSVPYNRYELVVSSVGYKARTFQLPPFTSSIIFVGNIVLSPEAKKLQDVIIVSKKTLIQQEVGKLVYNVAADQDSKSSNTFDILRKVPMLSVDGDDKLQLNGSSSYKVLINGRNSSLFARNTSDVFKMMAADMVDKIEVITNPPARYQSEGLAGIINVITHKKKVNGYNGSVSVSGDLPAAYAIGGFLTAKANKAGISVNVGNSFNQNPSAISTYNRIDKIVNLQLNQAGESKSDNVSTFINSEFSWEFDSLNLFTATLSNNDGKGNGESLQQVSLVNSAGAINQSYENTTTNTSKWHAYDFGADWQHQFRNNKNRLLTLSFKQVNNKNTGDNYIAVSSLFNYPTEKNYSFNSNQFQENTWQADYVHPLFGQTLEAGFKSITRHNNSVYGYSNYDTSKHIYLQNLRLGNDFSYLQKISSLYLSFSLKHKDWAFTTGAKMETTNVDAEFKSSGTLASQHYVSIIPTINLTRKFINNSSASFSYTQRIERPSLYYIDPFVDLSDPRNIYYGNDRLLPAIINAFNLSYFTFINQTSFTAALFHQFTNNAIERYTTLGTDTVSRTTYGNVGKQQVSGFSLSSNISFNNLNIAINTTGNYTRYASNIKDLPAENNGLSYTLFTYVGYRFKKGWRTNMSINYSSSNVMLQGKQSGFVSNTIAVTKSFFRNSKGNATLTISNPFQQYRRFFTVIDEPTFTQQQQSSFIVRRFTVSFHYRFGKLKEDISHKKRGIKNDDLKAGN